MEQLIGEFDELHPGTRLLNGQYTISKFIANGGFGITYLATDSFGREVVIKECFLSSMCRRSKAIVAPRSRAYQAELKSLVDLFVLEAHSLAKLAHPNIVAVHQVFEDNNTAYMAMDYVNGRDLAQLIDDPAYKFTPDQIVRITEKLLSAIGFVHQNDILHRDIAPDNILIDKSGEPILIDFGAAREKASKKSRVMSALQVVKDGYSPQEFYVSGSDQGPSSDLYALGATIYHLISGKAPVNGQIRLSEIAEGRPDSYQPLSGCFPGYPNGYLEALDQALKTLPKNRIQSAPEWLNRFKPGLRADGQAEDGAGPAALKPLGTANGKKGKSALLMGTVATVIAAGVAFAYYLDPTAGKSARAGQARDIAATVPVQAAAKLVPAGLPPQQIAAAPAAAKPVEPDAAAGSPAPALAPAVNAGIEPNLLEVTAEGTAAPAEASAKAVIEIAPDQGNAAAEVLAPVAAPATATAALTGAIPVPKIETAVAVPVSVPKIVANDAAVPDLPTVAEIAVPAPTPLLALVAKEQIALAVWDVRLPFSETMRIVNGTPAIVISRVDPEVSLALAGDWIKPGLSIVAINDKIIQSKGSIAGMILNDMILDPDGYVRVAVRYVDGSGQEKTGILAVGAVRFVGLRNGVNLEAKVIDGRWTTTVASIEDGSATSLQPGDVIFRDKSTGVAFDGSGTVEDLLPGLVARNLTTLELAVVRGSAIRNAFMQLAIADGTDLSQASE